jgi:hypothetical protein
MSDTSCSLEWPSPLRNSTRPELVAEPASQIVQTADQYGLVVLVGPASLIALCGLVIWLLRSKSKPPSDMR